MSAARQAAVFIAGTGGSAGELTARLLSVWPAPVGGGGEGKPVAPENLEQEKEVKAAAIGTLETAQSRAFGLDQKDGLYDGGAGGNKGYVLTVPVVGEGGRAAAAITLLIEARSKAAVQSTLAMAEVLAGYVTLHAGRQEIKRMQQAGLSMELATRLIGAINAAPNFKERAATCKRPDASARCRPGSPWLGRRRHRRHRHGGRAERRGEVRHAHEDGPPDRRRHGRVPTRSRRCSSLLLLPERTCCSRRRSPPPTASWPAATQG